MASSSKNSFDRNYKSHLNHLRLKGLQPKTTEAYFRAIRRIGEFFDYRIEALTEPQLVDYVTALIESHSSVMLDLFGLKAHKMHSYFIGASYGLGAITPQIWWLHYGEN